MDRCIFLILFVFCFPYISKGQTQKEKFADFIVSHNRENTSIMGRFQYIYLYIPSKCDSGTMRLTFPTMLEAIHQLHFKDMDYTEFLNDVFNEKITLDCSVKISNESFFEADSVILNMDFIPFINKYCIEFNSNIYKIKEDIAYNDYCNVVHYLFKRDYITDGGEYYCTKLEKLLEDLSKIK